MLKNLSSKPKKLAVAMLVSSISVPALWGISPVAQAGSCCGCERCAAQAISRAKSKSSKAFAKLHASIFELGRVFLEKSEQTSTAIYASTENITTKIDVATRVNKQLMDSLNAQQEIRAQQTATITRKRDLEEVYNPSTISRNLQTAFATQEQITASEYNEFISDYQGTYSDLVKQKRNTLLSQYVVEGEEFKEAEGLLWGGEIQTADEAAYVLFMTQQILFGGDSDPFGEVYAPDPEDYSSSRDYAAYQSAKVTWANRIKPSIDLFAFDQGLRTKPNEELPSVLTWLETNINDSLYSAEGVMEMYAQGSRADLMEGIAVEQKKLNLLRYINTNLDQIQERILASNMAISVDGEAKGLRNAVNKNN